MLRKFKSDVMIKTEVAIIQCWSLSQSRKVTHPAIHVGTILFTIESNARRSILDDLGKTKSRAQSRRGFLVEMLRERTSQDWELWGKRKARVKKISLCVQNVRRRANVCSDHHAMVAGLKVKLRKTGVWIAGRPRFDIEEMIEFVWAEAEHERDSRHWRMWKSTLRDTNEVNNRLEHAKKRNGLIGMGNGRHMASQLETKNPKGMGDRGKV